MTEYNNGFLQNSDVLNVLRKELEQRRIILTSMAEDSSKKMDEADREHILQYLRDGYLPEHPNNIPCLMKEFASSGLSYSVTRNYLKTFIGKFPGSDNIAEALSRAFGENGFLKDDNWFPQRLNILIDEICRKKGWQNKDIGTKVPDSRILGLLKDGAKYFETALTEGIESYFDNIKAHLTSPESSWEYAVEFSGSIRQLGVALASDYFKNIGFHQYVKPDFHFLREFPQLAGLPEDIKPRDQFIIAWHLSEALGITAFYLDHLLYQWGRYGETGRNIQKKSRGDTKSNPQKVVIQQKTMPGTEVRPESIWRQIYSGLSLEEIKQVNPFASYDWLGNTSDLSPVRKAPINALFSGRDEVPLEDIKRLKTNAGKYAAFRAITHGIAVWDSVNQKLIKRSR